MKTTYYSDVDMTISTNMTFDSKRYAKNFEIALAEFAAIEKGEIVNKTSVASESENRPVDHYNHRLTQELVPGKSLEHSLKLWEKVNTFVSSIRNDYKHIIFNGIGGSYLGPYMLIQAMLGDDYNLSLQKRGLPSLHFLANTDSDSFSTLFDLLDVKKTLMVTISKSGSTAETATNTQCYLNLLTKASLSPSAHCIAITIPGSNLHKLAASWLQTFEMCEPTGGRTSICSAVAMVPCAFAGIKFDEFLKGMAQMDCETRKAEGNPALEIAAMIDSLIKKFAAPKNMIILGYSESLKQYAHYCQQLYMESLGKEYCKDGRIQPSGLSVYGGIGTGEQHAFMQQIQKGVADSFVKFIQFQERKHEDYEDSKAGSMGRQLLAFLKGTELALSQNGREFMTITVKKCSEFCIGQLIALEERIVSTLGAFWGINAYDQPGVQDGKKAATRVNELSMKLDKELKACHGTSAEILAKMQMKEDAWLVEGILSDMVYNSKSYKTTLKGSRTFQNQKFVFKFE
ncbi:Glucose-6-phosphate isomerase [Spironucleus salmonicida]|uniref:Glucose-6-phosphate isomerase n=2 Tax=Spironucleus TaxID=39709 RepID=V6LTL8_9EUKA|nr:Glucose-6-phosphate isomerase [Spironucleus salmonicida]|eukprot:EST47593.1 Glucose-6-phosphate isomerase [Spironucleus salmonicida]